MIVEAKIPGQNTLGASDYIVNPEERFLEKGRAFVNKTLIKGSKTVPDECYRRCSGNIHGNFTCKDDGC